MAERKKLNNQSGFSLIEVVIAIALFTVFAVVFVTGQGYNLLDSAKLREDILLKDLTENKINELIINPPEFRDSLTLAKEVKVFEKFPDYEYSIEYKKVFIPDMNKITGQSAEEKDEEKTQSQMEKRIFSIFKENMEKMIWQVSVTVKNKLSNESYQLSTWMMNHNAEVNIGSF